MKIFNLGALEVLFIVILALIVLGPERTIKVAGDVAGWVKDFVKSPFWKELVSASKEIRDLPKKVMDDEDFAGTINELDGKASIIGTSLNDVRRSINKRLNEESKQDLTEDQIAENLSTKDDQNS